MNFLEEVSLYLPVFTPGYTAGILSIYMYTMTKPEPYFKIYSYIESFVNLCFLWNHPIIYVLCLVFATCFSGLSVFLKTISKDLESITIKLNDTPLNIKSNISEFWHAFSAKLDETETPIGMKPKMVRFLRCLADTLESNSSDFISVELENENEKKEN